MSKGPFIIKRVFGDLLPFLDVEWEGQDITGFTAFLNIRRPNGTRVVKSAIIDEPNLGGAGTAKFHFEWVTGDLLVGDSDAEIEVFDGLLNETFRGLIIQVVEEIA